MPQLPLPASSFPPTMPVFYANHSKIGQLSVYLFDPTSYSMESSKIGLPKISFPDPPRPPTPGPPPRPPPIPPRPPVPTPPPSPSSSAEADLLQGLVARQLSIIAVRLIDVWTALGVPVSLPHPPRPPTPGPRPGPVGPRPDVPTPPPSPRRSTGGLVSGTTSRGEKLEISYLGEASSKRPLNEHLSLRPDVFVPIKLTTSYDSRESADVDGRGELYDDKLTNYLDNRGETRLHTHFYSIASKDPYLGSYSANESSCSIFSLHAGAGTVRNDPDLLRVPSLRQLSKAHPDLFDAARGLSLLIAWPGISGIRPSPASSISACTSTLDQRPNVAYKMPSKDQDTLPPCGRSSSQNSLSRVAAEIALLTGPRLLGLETSGTTLNSAGTRLVGSLEPTCCTAY
ncbi:uncharacterized protein GGS22DRAFT_195123 [Annulohypoxylon maeteangense]|uniref:uncharacterized protein n=1 Tax=Annulohypoxylon maeteangense TaxID=1927788 RepID=UPI00200823A2|nr:uncharacterized protein GGS22DRAFT_195123 [Annulohypoxylon maeteangense]KAI0884024.1 hypothetical protein GGS22DRAFT_195123 [Annulohypoxylon maeteangense]